jgi:hypothetical protein
VSSIAWEAGKVYPGRCLILLLSLLLVSLSCSEECGPNTDTIPPAAVFDLACSHTDTVSITLTWTASGDDSLDGVASAYDIRYSITPIDRSSWLSATQCPNEQVPLTAGSMETYIVEGLSQETTYYLAIKVGDDAPSWSGLSNIVEAATRESGYDGISPASVDDLEAALHDAERVHLRWTAPGDDGRQGTAEEYDIRLYSSEIDTSNWRLATQVSGEPDPAPSGTVQTMMVRGLSAGSHYFAMKTRDEDPDSPNWSGLSNSPHTHVPHCQWGAPAMTTDFWKVETVGSGSVRIKWFLCANCGHYTESCDIRVSRTPIDDWNWESAYRCPGQPTVEYDGHHWVYGNFEYLITGLESSTIYYIAVRADDGGCVSHPIFTTVTTGSTEK